MSIRLGENLERTEKTVYRDIRRGGKTGTLTRGGKEEVKIDKESWL